MARAGLDVRGVSVDRAFQRIFESRDLSTDWRTHERRRQKILSHVAGELVALGPDEALRRLSDLEQEAAAFGWHDGHDRHFSWTISSPNVRRMSSSGRALAFLNVCRRLS